MVKLDESPTPHQARLMTPAGSLPGWPKRWIFKKNLLLCIKLKQFLLIKKTSRFSS
jgi:hypothetical protein